MRKAQSDVGAASSLCGRAEPLLTSVPKLTCSLSRKARRGETQVKEGDAEAAGEPTTERKKLQG